MGLSLQTYVNWIVCLVCGDGINRQWSLESCSSASWLAEFWPCILISLGSSSAPLKYEDMHIHTLGWYLQLDVLICELNFIHENGQMIQFFINVKVHSALSVSFFGNHSNHSMFLDLLLNLFLNADFVKTSEGSHEAFGPFFSKEDQLGLENLQGWKQPVWAICSNVWLSFQGRSFSLNLSACSLSSSLCPAVQSPVLFPWWLPIGMGAAGKFPQSHPISRLTKPSSLSPSAQGECSSPSHVGDLLWAAASLLVLFFYQRPKTGPSPSAAVYLPALFHTRENNSSCLLPLRNWRLRKFLKSTSFKRLCSTWQSLKWVTVAAYNPHHSLLELKSTCSGFFCSLCLLL